MNGILGAASGGMLAGGIIITIFLLFILFIVLIGIAARYKKCPSDQVLVIFGKTRGDKAARCIHGGAAFIWDGLSVPADWRPDPAQCRCLSTG